MNWCFEGVCGRTITEDRYSDMVVFMCDGGVSMTCDDGGCADDLCEGCSNNPEYKHRK